MLSISSHSYSNTIYNSEGSIGLKRQTSVPSYTDFRLKVITKTILCPIWKLKGVVLTFHHQLIYYGVQNPKLSVVSNGSFLKFHGKLSEGEDKSGYCFFSFFPILLSWVSVPFLISTPTHSSTPWLLAFGTESHGIVVKIYSYEMRHTFKNKLHHQSSL